jgi:hypothetical protein
MKTTRFELRLSEETKAKWQQCAVDSGCSLSDWIHGACDYATHVPESGSDVRTKAPGTLPGVRTLITTNVPSTRKHHPRCPCDICRPKK